jgi:hypothetical protein
MPTKICERQLSFVGYAGWRIGLPDAASAHAGPCRLGYPVVIVSHSMVQLSHYRKPSETCRFFQMLLLVSGRPDYGMI